MQNVVNKDKSQWLRPWNLEKFDDLYNRDERYFSILLKGAVHWLTENIILYNKPIKHFIFNTGSAYMYVESNGYEFSWNETSGEDQMYMQTPRCLITIEDINIPQEELTTQFVRMVYERRDGNDIKGYTAETRRLPIEWNITLNYTLSNMNEGLVLVQELIDKVIWQQYFNIIYLGQTIECSIEFPANFKIEWEKIDMASPTDKNKHISVNLKICSNYPIINERTEIDSGKVIKQFGQKMDIYSNEMEVKTDIVEERIIE